MNSWGLPLGILFALPLFIGPAEANNPVAKRLREKREIALMIKKNREDCSTYDEELAELKISRTRVERFRQQYLDEHFRNLLDDYLLAWNILFDVWSQGTLSDRRFIHAFRQDYRYLRWYHKRDDQLTFAEALAELQDKYKTELRKFAERHFVVEPWDRYGRQLALRRLKRGNRVLPVGTILELADGELVLSRYGKLKVDEEFGGFILDFRVRNDVYASQTGVVARRENLRNKSPSPAEVLLSARQSATVSEASRDFNNNEIRLALFLDPRFENCEKAKSVNPIGDK